ncbi:LysE family translocator [Massilia endophytica]|uniref:LysE family translocator n=1 Tax=Massilia endophytica TaxID=2899220 RepID=UPI001E3A20D1|nr:LysE family translocator [Massilia endophytica]UGQ44567.1 LysE family translocator [Massilia endophytica]
MNSYLLFTTTTFLVCLAPGPAALIVASHGAVAGWRAASWSIAGIALANAGYFILSAMGVAAALVSTPALFSAIKWTGVVYLGYLGLSSLLSRRRFVMMSPIARGRGGMPKLLQALLIELSNPKALLYFTALLPQFVVQSQPLAPQFVLFGATCLVADCLSYGGYALLGSRTGTLRLPPAANVWANRLCGLALLGSAGLMTCVSPA